MREPDGRCELHKAELQIRHYKHGDVARCPEGCVEQGPPAAGLLSSPSRIGQYHGGRMKVPVMKAPHG